ncbi:hypothetical protein [Alistipes senegalensis]|uniref:hypothetical protein n=1 Tax=Alistipes senegalensis TaxID=1288121 RepID=UPI0024313C64|nr:hypothetical protein [Alistipes senegalensis]MDY4571379.1 hypothetical protein [Alistipes senegalensis]
MYVPDHLKLRIALARQLKAFYYEDGNSSRNRKRIYRAYGKYLGTTYDTFLNYLKEGKYDLSGIKLTPHIVATTALLEPIRTACERLYARRPNALWTLPEIAAEVLAVLHKEAEEGKPVRKLRIY